jgi:NAD(P)-dependent dehydrogenase (short-subunit alcohol dehydrogenase family)
MDKPVVLITGALTGIGRATAVAFAKKGARVVIAGRRDEARNDNTRVLTEVREADVGAQVVVVFKTLAVGKATLVFALTRGEHPKVYESRRFAVEVR